MRQARRLLGVAVILVLAACASPPKDMNPQPSTALPQETPSTLRAAFQPFIDEHEGLSGFYFYALPQRALFSRIAMIDLAEHTLDLQYFIWKGDSSGTLVMQRVVRAADRGVRVRLLLDDFYAGEYDFGLAAIDEHPNIQVRLYNPWSSRLSQSWARGLAFLGDFSRLNHRMHNKLAVADNQVAIVGGRNIADEYFGLHEESNYNDFDLLAVGPVVDSTSHGFDRFWNGDWSVSIDTVVKKQADPAEAARMRAEFLAEEVEGYEELQAEFTPERVREGLAEFADRLVWGHGQFVYDPPRKDLAEDAEDVPVGVTRVLDQLAQEVQSDLLIVSPYLVPVREEREAIAELVRRGVRVRILTNSLLSNDVRPAQFGYMEKREELVASGAEVYELRADASSRLAHQEEPDVEEALALHAKAVVVDRETVFLGSFNLDQRAEYVNTEAALLVQSAELAEEVIRAVEISFLPQNSYRVRGKEMIPQEDGPFPYKVKGGLVWETAEDGQLVVYDKEPHLGFFTRMLAGFFTILPVERHL